MARAKEPGNEHREKAMDRLDTMMADLAQAQISLVKSHAILNQTQTEFVAEMGQIRREMAETNRRSDERFARIETILLDHSRILAEHTRILQALPDAVRAKIGFKASETRR